MRWVSPLSDRIEATAPLIAAQNAAEYLQKAIRPRLRKAVDEGRLAIGISDIHQHVKVTRSEHERDAFDLVGGRYNQRRDPRLADLRTPDDGWLFFSAILRPVAAGLQVVAYDIERVFGPHHRPAWIRFDLNPPGHPNDHRGIRSHFHVDNDDLQLHAPIFAPHELLEILLSDLGPRQGRKPRTKGIIGDSPG